METFRNITIAFMAIGVVGLVIAYSIIYNEMNMARLSMGAFGKKIIEHGPGLSFKWFWFKLQKFAIDTSASVTLTSGGVIKNSYDDFLGGEESEEEDSHDAHGHDAHGHDVHDAHETPTHGDKHKGIKPKVYETSDSVVYVYWAAGFKPLKGFLSNFVNMTPGLGALTASGKIDIAFSDYLATITTDEALSSKKEISKIVGKVFGGDKKISKFEKKYGALVIDPMIFDINLGKKSKDAKESLYASRELEKALKGLRDEVGLTPDKATDAYFVLNKLADKKIITYTDAGTIAKAIGDIASAFFKKP